MRSKKQILASQRNGARSHGPSTAEGKARSSLNATRHGLSSRVVVLTNEDPELWQQLRASCLEQWQPANSAELTLVHDIAGARWRLHRLLAMEAATLDNEMDLQRSAVNDRYTRIDEPTRCALAFNTLSDGGRSLVNYGRNESRLRRIIDRAAAELRRLRQERSETALPPKTDLFQNEPEKPRPPSGSPESLQ